MASKELVAASSRPLILSILGHGKNYGYNILRDIREMSGGRLEWSEGMLYPVLHRLEKERLVRSSWQTSEGRRRRYYRLTERGKRQLDKERSSWLAVHRTLTQLWGPAHV